MKKIILSSAVFLSWCSMSFAQTIDHRISIENVRGSSSSGFGQVSGDLTNSSPREFTTVCVSYKLYDNNNTLVGNAQDCAQNLGASEKWHFKAISTEQFSKFEYGSAIIIQK